jgi:release factor glutamine methyltransferase
MPHRRAHPDEPNWTTRRLLDWTGKYLQAKAVDSPRLAAEMLLAHVLEMPRINLYMDPDRPATPLERAAFRELVEKAAAHAPVQYLVGHAHFYSLSFAVNEHTLIPRPCTETLVEHVITHARRTPGFADCPIADIGTGSGAIAVALAKNLPGSRIVATDISEAALAVAKRNAVMHGVADRIDFRLGPLLEPLGSGRFGYIVSNPPYIPDHEWPDVARNVKDYEPVTALRGGPDGLDVLRPLIAGAPAYLNRPGQIVFEIAAAARQAALDLAAANPNLTNPHILPDHENLPRILLADRL